MLKRLFDILLAIMLLCLLAFPILLCVIFATIDTKSFGIFSQERIGQFEKSFTIYKIRTMKGTSESSVSTARMNITKLGSLLRKYKIDELPQLWNIIIGQMSFVGPRPDVAKYYSNLSSEEKKFLTLKPGITGLAQLKYRDEEEMLSKQTNPEEYYETIIWKDKVSINNEYAKNRNFQKDISILFQTIKAVLN